MIRFYFHPTPNPAKVALVLEETGLAYQLIPIDTSKGEQHTPAFRAINPNGKVPAIVDTEGPGGKEARVFDSGAILLYLGEKTGRLIGSPADRPELLSWLFFIATGIGPFSGQPFISSMQLPEKLGYAVNRYRREIERHYEVLDKHLKGREFIVGKEYSIVDISAWGWLDRAPRVLPGDNRSADGLSESEALVPRDRFTASSGESSCGRKGPCLQERDRRRGTTRVVPVELRQGGELIFRFRFSINIHSIKRVQR